MPSELLFHLSWLLTGSGVFSLSGGTEAELAEAAGPSFAGAPSPQLPADAGGQLLETGDGAAPQFL